MDLVEYQEKMVEEIYQLLIDDAANKGVILSGETGSGKSTIVYGIIEELKEDWTVFYIKGVGENLSPYFTWHIGTKLYSEKRSSFDGKVSFGLNFLPVQASLEFDDCFRRKEKNFILTPNEEALTAGIKNQAAGIQNILIVADDYEQWDAPSKQYLGKVTLLSTYLFPEHQVSVLIVAQEEIPKLCDFEWKKFTIETISDQDIRSILTQEGFSLNIKISDIRSCAGNDIALILMVANYYSNGDISTINFNSIMDKRYQNLSKNEREACDILKPLSIIDSYFTKEETAFFMSTSSEDNKDWECQAEEYLSLAKKQAFISGDENYTFVSSDIRAYFEAQLSRRVKYYHLKFAEYLQSQQPEDYYCRGKHLRLGLSKNDKTNISDACQLLFLAYIRRSAKIGLEQDIYNIKSEIVELLGLMNSEQAEKQSRILKEMWDGYSAFMQYDYKRACELLSAISIEYLCPALKAECKRIIVLCYTQLANSPFMIRQTAEELYRMIEDSNFCEDEQYCRAALVLLNVYTDRAIEDDRVETLKKKFSQCVDHHANCPEFDEFRACYSRKASLFCAAAVARKYTAESVRFYRNHNNPVGLYMALCNHAANLLIYGDYKCAEQSLDECTKMTKNNDIGYPSPYKVENNICLLNYLQDEVAAAYNERQIIASARKASKIFSRITTNLNGETSHVALFNHLSLSVFNNLDGWYLKLQETKDLLLKTDAYYQFFLHDLSFAASVLKCNITVAEEELRTLDNLCVPLLRPYETIFETRRQAQGLLLKNSTKMLEIHNNPIAYHKYIAEACTHTQDSSCIFYGRAFLLSDLQFLSF